MSEGKLDLEVGLYLSTFICLPVGRVSTGTTGNGTGTGTGLFHRDRDRDQNFDRERD